MHTNSVIVCCIQKYNTLFPKRLTLENLRDVILALFVSVRNFLRNPVNIELVSFNTEELKHAIRLTKPSILVTVPALLKDARMALESDSHTAVNYQLSLIHQ